MPNCIQCTNHVMNSCIQLNKSDVYSRFYITCHVMKAVFWSSQWQKSWSYADMVFRVFNVGLKTGSTKFRVFRLIFQPKTSCSPKSTRLTLFFSQNSRKSLEKCPNMPKKCLKWPKTAKNASVGCLRLLIFFKLGLKPSYGSSDCFKPAQKLRKQV